MHYGYSPEPGSENNQYRNSIEGSVCAVQNWWAIRQKQPGTLIQSIDVNVDFCEV